MTGGRIRLRADRWGGCRRRRNRGYGCTAEDALEELRGFRDEDIETD
jgi:hypothetical protein